MLGWWRQQAPLQRRWTSPRLHSVTTRRQSSLICIEWKYCLNVARKNKSN
jgi:hypothetical protein